MLRKKNKQVFFEGKDVADLKSQVADYFKQNISQRYNMLSFHFVSKHSLLLDYLDEYLWTEMIEHIVSGQTLVDVNCHEDEKVEKVELTVFVS
ncbi:hypothetical protein [Aureibacter tunicatorum]|uniref:Uncharacterized protein n=1 Tax=Aureibacter tunicatorum TaxID=866807 RepID=A0AAE3XPJ3_9BACT|nr:hypothetical protein [Aureibacter tunicatorum]MDR6239685.1 hypothetical protein [Aureibacter tunicatorum]BDD04161.1 hypothetical protein AUTU_16440 [Aureibacter tunicatorum]